MKTVEEIITGLKCCCEMADTTCRDCPYEDSEISACSTLMKGDALALILELLEENKPIEIKIKAAEERLRAIAAGMSDDQEEPDTLCPPNSGHDPVNHPSHYTQGGIECIDALEAATMGLEGIEAVCTANAIKYAWRWKQKNGVEDIDKAIWYLTHLKGHLTEEEQS